MTTTPTTSTTTTNRVSVDLREPAELLAAMPQLLGFRPSDSVVVIAHGGRNSDLVGHVMRADLPPPGSEPALAVLLRTPLLEGPTTAVTLAVIGRHREERSAGPPHRALVGTVKAVLAGAGVRTMHALWAPDIRAGAPWGCYDDSVCGGVLPDPGSTVFAAVAAHAGAITYTSREALERRLAPDDPEALARRAALLDSATDALAGAPEHEVAVERGLDAVRRALEHAQRGDPEFSDAECVELALALAHSKVRDACLATALPVAHPRAETAERLWLALVRAIPAPERAHAASLLAYSAYVRGNGALAGMAVTNAREADPGHVLSSLLAQALDHALPPDRLAQLGQSCDASVLWGPSAP